MKWFKHFADMRFDPKIRRLINKYGIVGYGLYNAILEGIAYQLETDSPIPDLEEGSGDIAEQFNMDTLKVEEIVKFCIDEDLFQKNDETGKIMCLKMLSHLDNTMSSNPQVKSILDNFKKLKVSSSNLKKLKKTFSRLDKIRLDENRSEKSKEKLYNVSTFVRLSRQDYKELRKIYPTKTDIRWAINKLDAYIDSSEKGKKYKNHRKVLREGNWVHEEWVKHKAQSITTNSYTRKENKEEVERMMKERGLA